VPSSIVLHCLDYAMSSQTMIVTCVISVTRIRFLTGSRTLLIMSLIILSVIIYCVFFCLKMKKKKKMNEKNKHVEKSSILGGVAWM